MVNGTTWARQKGFSFRDSEDLLSLKPRTVREWRHQFDNHGLCLAKQGRPARESTYDEKRAVFGKLNTLGFYTGTPTLKNHFPYLPRNELSLLLDEYRKIFIDKENITIHTLKWIKPGTVWAIDFTEAPLRIDGLYDNVFMVRDLASSNNLLWLPVHSMTKEVAIDALRHLFAVHGPPLVIKNDMAGCFTCPEVAALLEEFGVLQLTNPPETPRYNGAAEAGIGDLKVHTHYAAARRGFPNEWTCEDLEAARCRANWETRPNGHDGPCPEESWRARERIAWNLRKAIHAEYSKKLVDVCREYGYNNIDETGRVKGKIMRETLSRVCVEFELLEYRKRRVTVPILLKKVAIFKR